MKCSNCKSVRDDFFNSMNKKKNLFSSLSDQNKLLCIISIKLPGINDPNTNQAVSKLFTNYIKSLSEIRLSNSLLVCTSSCAYFVLHLCSMEKTN